MDFCWHCPVCDMTFSLKNLSPEELQQIKDETKSGASYFFHEVDGQEHLIEMVERKH